MDLSSIFRSSQSLSSFLNARVARNSDRTMTSSQAAGLRRSISAKSTPPAREVIEPGSPEAANAQQLRDLVGKYNFRSITPRQMADLAGELIEKKELSAEAADSFFGIEKNLAVAIDENKPIDLVAHYNHMLGVVQDASVKEPGYMAYAMQYRQIASKTFQDIMSFSASQRLHIVT